MMKGRPKPTTTENHPDLNDRPSTRALNEEKKSSKSVDPIELLEKRLAKLGGGLVSATSASDQEQTTETIGAADELRVFPEEPKESVNITNLALLKRIEDSRERARFAQQKLKGKEESGRQEQRQREAFVVQQQQEEFETGRLMNVSPPSYNQIEAEVEQTALEHVSKTLYGEVSTTTSKEELKASSTYSPSAPPAEDASEVNCKVDIGYRPEVEEESSPPPSYEEFEQAAPLVKPTIYSQEEAPETVTDTETGAAFAFDAFGNLITSEEKQRIEDEQRRILETILRENSKKDDRQSMVNSNGASSIVESFDRLPSMIQSPFSQHPSTSRNSNIAHSTIPTLARNPHTNHIADALVHCQSSFRTVTVGPGKQIQVHDQTKTREAILRGTAVLVECVSCSKWMQVSDSAKLMYCPCCESVVPVIPQYKVKTQDDAIRITRDRQLAERLQSEYTLENENSGSINVQGGHSDGELTFNSWREYVTAIFSTAPKLSGDQRSRVNSHGSALNVFSYPADGRCMQESKEDSANPVSQERSQLYVPKIYGNEENSRSNEEEEATSFLPARVASQQQSLFSCVEKSFSTVLSSMGRFRYGEEKNDEVDEELLALTNHNLLLREDTTNSSEYHRLFDSEDGNC